MVRPCQRISTSMSPEQASSGAMRWTSTVCPFLSGEATLGAMHRALPDFQGIDHRAARKDRRLVARVQRGEVINGNLLVA